MGVILALALVSAPFLLAAASTQPDGYRLAGIMVVGDDHIGFLELPQGGQVLVRAGSTVNGGRVVEFSARTLRLAFPDAMLEFMIEGSKAGPARLVANPAPGGAGRRVGDGAVTREVGVEPLLDALVASRAAAGKPGSAPSGEGPGAAGQARSAAAGRTTRRGGTATDAANRFVTLLDLPANARIVAVNEHAVKSADEAISAVEISLLGGTVARLNLEGNPSVRRVYLMPARDGRSAPTVRQLGRP